jgi:ribosomal protein S18 acetylase RimI-like enzyme
MDAARRAVMASGMAAFTLSVPRPDELEALLAVLRTWQSDAAPVPLHPGDLGWHHPRGAEATAADLRLWSRDGRPAALGMLDGPDLVRLAVAPALDEDAPLSRTLAADLADPVRGVLPAGRASVEARSAPGLRRELLARGWAEGEPWVPLRRDLAAPVEEGPLRIETVEGADVAAYAAVHRAAFDSIGVTEARLRTMLAGPAHREATSLLGRDDSGAAVAVITAWSAGPGRPGLIEPLGASPAHRGRGHGRAMCLAAAAWLRDRGASSADVCTPRSLTGAIATYRSAGFRALPDVPDLVRPGG